MKDYYVILTGSKNNAGDFLIKYRAKQLFRALRPDREVVDIDAWKPLDSDLLEQVNAAKALILLGGPALKQRMYPRVYALTDDLSDIKTPVTSMGIGWSSAYGRWRDSYQYPLSEPSLALLKRAQDSGLPLSVRDYHTMSALNFHGLSNVSMTGCPAYYDLAHLGRKPAAFEAPRKVAFSLGVSFTGSASMDRAMKAQVLGLKRYFADAAFEVVFHHSLSKDALAASYGKRAGRTKHAAWHGDFAQWLDQQQIAYVDISGSAEALIEYYSGVDVHFGYRVHAHIFMNSISRFSVLIAEDGRGKATERVIGGNVIDGFSSFNKSRATKLLARLGYQKDAYVANQAALQDALNRYEYELYSQGQTLQASRALIDQNYQRMQDYLARLP